MNNSAANAVAVAMPVILGLTINADAAVGAVFGAAFFLLSTAEHSGWRKAGYAAVSAGVGYAAGLAVGAPWAMLASAGGAAVAVVALASIIKTINTIGLAGLLDLLRGKSQ